jgi:hypothetical protein
MSSVFRARAILPNQLPPRRWIPTIGETQQGGIRAAPCQPTLLAERYGRETLRPISDSAASNAAVIRVEITRREDNCLRRGPFFHEPKPCHDELHLDVSRDVDAAKVSKRHVEVADKNVRGDRRDLWTAPWNSRNLRTEVVLEDVLLQISEGLTRSGWRAAA